MTVESEQPPTQVFERLLLGRWRQFKHVDIAFHPRVTVLTGANGSGKTTILNLLSRHFGWHVAMATLAGLTPPEREILHELEAELSGAPVPPAPRGWDQYPAGLLTYSSGERAVIFVREPPDAQAAAGTSADVAIPSGQTVNGLNIPSHRSVSGYQSLSHIPARFSAAQQILESFINESRNRYLGWGSGAQVRSPFYWMKEALLAAALYGEGNSNVAPNDEARAIWREFQAILGLLFPAEFGFQRLYVRSPDVVVSTTGGDFPLEGLSGGLMALTEVAWQVYLRSRNSSGFVVCIDEPENHLHPALQRLFLPRMTVAFPYVQFVVSTHSPFIVGSMADARVYVLAFNHDGLVESSELDVWNRAGSASEILRDVLGLDTTLPLWAEEKLRELVDRYATLPVTADSLSTLRMELEQLGLTEVGPQVVAEVVRRGAPPSDPTP